MICEMNGNQFRTLTVGAAFVGKTSTTDLVTIVGLLGA
jgi:hypothetical protein